MKNLFILLSLLLSFNSYADFRSTSVLYQSGDYAKAYAEFLVMAKVGEKRSQFNLGVMYYQGKHVEANIDKAYAWTKLSVQSEIKRPDQEKIFQFIASKIDDKTQAEKEFNKLDLLYSTEVLMDELYPVFVKPVGKNAFKVKPDIITAPKWPRSALMNGTQGLVKIALEIDKSGAPRNIEIDLDVPKKLFNKATLSAVKNWRFKIVHKNSDINKTRSKKYLYTMEYLMEGGEKLTVKDAIYNKTKLATEEGDANAQYRIGAWDKTLKRSKNGSNPNQWFLKSSIQGHPAAQYQLALSLVNGRGCIIDKSKALDWLIRSASTGHNNAKLLLATTTAEMPDLKSQQTSVQYFSEAKNLTPSARLSYAWLLTKSPYKEITNPKKALELVDDFSVYYFKDDTTIYEIKAAAYAAMGNYKKAVSYQEDALDEAEDMNVDLDDIKAHLVVYKNNEKWF